VWLTQYDVQEPGPPIEIGLERRVTIGERKDHAWAHLSSPLRLAGTDVVHVIVGARHSGDDVWSPTRWPVHVYVCTVPEELQDRDRFTPDQVTIAMWGLLHETLDRALTDTY
jgi:hypothetical protein